MKNREVGDLPPEQKKFSPDFVTKVKAEFPAWTDLHESLDTGSDYARSDTVGRRLKDRSHELMNPNDIVKALESGKQEEVLEKAKRAAGVTKLYAEWLDSCHSR